MTNHPNRNWRRAMHTAADAHLAGYRWPGGGGAHVMSSEQLRVALRAAYLAGYTDGRRWRCPLGDAAMTPADLAAWQAHMRFTQREAAAALGVTLPTYQQWRRGARFKDDAPVEIDRRTALACAALAAGITEWPSK